jgi:hypothetical protein
VALLVGEPWHLTIDEIKKLTPYRVRNHYFRERDEKGNLKLRHPGAAAPTYEEIFRQTWRGRGLSEAQVEAKWREYQAEKQARGKRR